MSIRNDKVGFFIIIKGTINQINQEDTATLTYMLQPSVQKKVFY